MAVSCVLQTNCNQHNSEYTSGKCVRLILYAVRNNAHIKLYDNVKVNAENYKFLYKKITLPS